MKLFTLTLVGLLASTGVVTAATLATEETASDKLVDCVKRAIRDILNGVTPMPCPVRAHAATPDPEAVLACAGAAVRDMANGVTPEPCTVQATVGGPDVKGFVECTKGQVQQVLQGVTPMPCAL